MNTTMCQRWRLRRGVWRPAEEIIQTHEYDVEPLSGLAAKNFVIQHHYSRTYPSARERFGLLHRGELVGVAVFSQPYAHVVTAMLGDAVGSDAPNVLELGRFVLLDRVPGNGESWFLGQTFRALRRLGYPAVISMSDPEPRTTSAGSIVHVGHIGGVYQASNAAYLRRGRQRIIRLLPDGRMLNDRVVQKIRHRERGWQYGVRSLVEAGAQEPAIGTDLAQWLQHWLPTLTRPMRHGGNHRYGWLLHRHSHTKWARAVSEPYPKFVPRTTDEKAMALAQMVAQRMWLDSEQDQRDELNDFLRRRRDWLLAHIDSRLKETSMDEMETTEQLALMAQDDDDDYDYDEDEQDDDYYDYDEDEDEDEEEDEDDKEDEEDDYDYDEDEQDEGDFLNDAQSDAEW